MARTFEFHITFCMVRHGDSVTKSDYYYVLLLKIISCLSACPMFIEPTITQLSSRFSGYIRLDTKIVLKKCPQMTLNTSSRIHGLTADNYTVREQSMFYNECTTFDRIIRKSKSHGRCGFFCWQSINHRITALMKLSGQKCKSLLSCGLQVRFVHLETD